VMFSSDEIIKGHHSDPMTHPHPPGEMVEMFDMDRETKRMLDQNIAMFWVP
jgi:hypothetical protein